MSSESRYASPVLGTAYAVVPHSEHCTLNRAGIEAFAVSLSSESNGQPGDLPFPDPGSWAREPLHPVPALHTPQEIADWIFTVSLLNFSFWSELPASERFGVGWRAANDEKPGHETVVKHTGYWSLPAAINRALKDDEIPITSPSYWLTATDAELERVFRASESSKEGIPLLDDRIRLLREAGASLCENYSGSFLHFIEEAAKAHTDAHPSQSVADNRTACDALSLVKAVVSAFPQFRDDHVHPAVGMVHLWKRPQILVAELWAAFSSVSHDPAFPQITGIENLTMFADYRVPQILHSLRLLDYSPHLESLLAAHAPLASGSELEISLRALSIVCVEELRAALVRRLREAGRDPEAQRVNAVTLDFWLWNEAKRREKAGEGQHVEHHRVRSIWY